MLFIHYLLFIPPAFLFGYYLRRKLRQLVPDPKSKWSNLFYYFLIFSIFIVSIITLSYFAVYFFYVVFFYLLFDLVFFLFHRQKESKLYTFISKVYARGITVFILALFVTLYGLYMANHPVIHHYRYDISKLDEPLSIAMLSDLHLGTGTNEYTIDEIVERVEKEQVDVLVLVGDIFDEMTPESLKEYAYSSFGHVITTYGVYYVEGNHDLLDEEVKSAWEKGGVQVLMDESRLIGDKFYLVGRKDDSRDDRLSLKELLSGVRSNYPIIVLDHQPQDEDQAYQLGVDLQLSGHTHGGQLFPGSFFVKHGAKTKDNYHLVISNGYGTWGIPIRTAGKSELVVVTLY